MAMLALLQSPEVEVLGIPIVTCGPGNRLIPHQVDEYVEANEIVDAAKIYAAAALKYLEA